MLKKILAIYFLLIGTIVLAQEDALVYFNAKTDVASALANPLTILTQEAIHRKNLRGTLIDFRDVPVDETYISQIKNTEGITVLAKSKWFNAVHVQGSEVHINNLLNESFVGHIEFFDRNLNESRVGDINKKPSIENRRPNFEYGNATTQVEMINVDDLHALGYTGEGVIIAALDAGFGNVDTMTGFQRLRDSGNILGVYDFYNRSENVYIDEAGYHGTISLSTMAGFFEGEYTGTAPNASFYLFRTDNAFGIDQPIEESLWIEAAERADSLGADIISSSLGFRGWFEERYSYTPEDMDGNTTYITRGANMAFEKGMLIVNSAGNEGEDGVIAPADAEHVLTVGAVYGSGEYAYFSSQGNSFQPSQKPDVVARGWNVAVIHESDEVRVAHGTSFSSPIVAGAIACLWQAVPSLTHAEIMQAVKQSASQYSTPDNFLGYGIPNFGLALNTLSSEDEEVNDFAVFPNPVSNNLQIIFPENVEVVNLELYNMLGKLIMKKTIFRNYNTINLKELVAGMYILKIQTFNHGFKTFKLLKK
ncbi:S8 family serine peptidase [Hanstruepera marina]|uniref:S8 family serine peptidase n=1 Tax=Hanstruepera marina TaxID=2873265 RepID=UPI001CA74912|nr:S8 family serine peptidase [Hanstruepera marina]